MKTWRTKTEETGYSDLKIGASVCPGLVYQGVSMMLKMSRGNRKEVVGLPAPGAEKG